MMENTAYVGLSHQLALHRQMDTVANNLANMNTTAYKSQRMLFQEYLMNRDKGSDISFVQDVSVLRNLTMGPTQPTGNPFDLAIAGRGYFVIETPEGTRYTRNGGFTADLEGLLTTRNGHPVLDTGGQAIILNPGDAQIDVSTDGTISTSTGAVAQLQVVIFEDEQELVELGQGLYASDETAVAAENPKIVQGMLEGSNVDPISEMVEMMAILRSYQTMQKLLNDSHELQRRSIRTLGQSV